MRDQRFRFTILNRPSPQGNGRNDSFRIDIASNCFGDGWLARRHTRAANDDATQPSDVIQCLHRPQEERLLSWFIFSARSNTLLRGSCHLECKFCAAIIQLAKPALPESHAKKRMMFNKDLRGASPCIVF